MSTVTCPARGLANEPTATALTVRLNVASGIVVISAEPKFQEST